MVILADGILITLAVITLLAATLFDLRTKEIPDQLSYGFIVVALLVRLGFSFTLGIEYFLFGLLGLLSMFLLGLMLYYGRVWGGGDSKVLMGLGAAFGPMVLLNIPLLLWLLFAIVIVGGLYSFIWSLVIYAKNFNKTNKKLKETMIEYKSQRLWVVVIVFALFLVAYFLNNPSTQFLIAIFAVAGVVGFYLHMFAKTIHDIGFIKKVDISKVTEGDWLAKDVKKGGQIICSAKTPGLEKKQIKRMKRLKIHKVWIKEGIPFLPAIFIATVVTSMIFILV